jgi:hypothetical protein
MRSRSLGLPGDCPAARDCPRFSQTRLRRRNVVPADVPSRVHYRPLPRDMPRRRRRGCLPRRLRPHDLPRDLGAHRPRSGLAVVRVLPDEQSLPPSATSGGEEATLWLRLLNTRYASRFRSRHHRCGPLFGQRFASQPVEDEAHLLLAAVYVVLNPVRAGLTRSADSWPWSSYCASARLADRPHWLSPIAELAIFGEDEHEADLRFCRMLEDAQLKFTGTVPFVDSPPGRSRTIGTVTQSESVRRFQSYS